MADMIVCACTTAADANGTAKPNTKNCRYVTKFNVIFENYIDITTQICYY